MNALLANAILMGLEELPLCSAVLMALILLTAEGLRAMRVSIYKEAAVIIHAMFINAQPALLHAAASLDGRMRMVILLMAVRLQFQLFAARGARLIAGLTTNVHGV